MTDKKIWGTITTVKVKDIPNYQMSSGKYRPLWKEIELRLEQTPIDKALSIQFEDKKSAQRAERALRRFAITHWKQSKHFKLRLRKNDTHHTLYVSRGEKWQKHVVIS